MNLVKPLSFLFAAVVLLGTAIAADNVTPVAVSAQVSAPLVQSGSGTVSMIAPGVNDNPSFSWRTARGQRIDRNPLTGVCFTMRSYKVKRTERLRDNESGLRGYSTCQMGSDYKVRSADDPQVKLR